MKGNTIEDIVNDIIKAHVHRPGRIYLGRISRYEINIIAEGGDKLVQLSASVWQDNYYNELAERARLDITIYDKEGITHKYISSQFVPLWDEEPDEIYLVIEKIIANFYEIHNYYKRMEELAKESPDISPGSPLSKLKHEFYNTEWEI